VGLDGRTLQYPQRKQRESVDAKEAPTRERSAFLVFSNEAMKLAQYDGPVDHDILEAARNTARAWNELVSKLEGHFICARERANVFVAQGF
jgi:hypothetical protein